MKKWEEETKELEKRNEVSGENRGIKEGRKKEKKVRMEGEKNTKRKEK